MPTNINTILDWFRTGKKPTQTQFWDSWKSFWHKEEIIPQSSIENLQASLDNKANIPLTLSFKGDIPDAANLNDYTSTGVYLQGADVYAAAGTNYPLPYAGHLEVVGNLDFTYQKYHSYGPLNEIYYRTYYSPSGWFGWKKVVHKDEIEHINWTTTIIDDFNTPIGFKLLQSINNSANIPANGLWAQGIQFSTNNDPAYANQLVFDINGNLFARSKINNSWTQWSKISLDENVLHTIGDETKSGSLAIDGNNRGYYLGNAGNNASILYNANGNLDITPRVGYNTIFTAGNVAIGSNNNPEYKLDVNGNAIIRNANTSDYKVLALSNPAYDNTSPFEGETRMYFQWADFEAGYIGAYKNTFNTSGLTFGVQYGYGNVVEKMRLDPEGRLLLGITDLITTDKFQVSGGALFTDNVKIGSDSHIYNDRNVLDFGSAGYAQPEVFNTNSNGDKIILYNNGTSYDGRIGIGDNADMWIKSYSPLSGNPLFGSFNIWTGNANSPAQKRLIITGDGNVLIGTSEESYSGCKLQINGRTSGEPAINSNEYVTKSQIETLPTAIYTEVELTIPAIGGFDYYEEFPYFEGARVGNFVDMVIPLSFSIPFLDIKCMCIDENKIMMRFTAQSQNYFPGDQGTFKFRIIR